MIIVKTVRFKIYNILSLYLLLLQIKVRRFYSMFILFTIATQYAISV